MVEHVFREYRREQDREAAHRIWLEVGWIEKDQAEVADLIIEAGRAHVAEVNGAAECLVLTAPGSLRYLKEDLPYFGVTGVTTSRIARKQGLASRLTARAVAAAVADGALVGGLSMFEQGYYNQVGFGTGSYERWIGFDPARLRISVRPRIPERLTGEDWEAIHAARLERLRGHGACCLYPAAITRSEFAWMKNAFGFGYYGAADGSGKRRLSHHIVGALKTVYDPEIPADIYELGLIYKIDVDDERNVDVLMTLTAPGCPVAGEMPIWVENAVASVTGVGRVHVELTFDPPWDMSRMSDEARLALNMF